jgi:hypothetical protein
MGPVGLQWMQDGRIPFNEQISNFESTVAQIAGAIAAAVATAGRLAGAVHPVSWGWAATTT